MTINKILSGCVLFTAIFFYSCKGPASQNVKELSTTVTPLKNNTTSSVQSKLSRYCRCCKASWEESTSAFAIHPFSDPKLKFADLWFIMNELIEPDQTVKIDPASISTSLTGLILLKTNWVQQSVPLITYHPGKVQVTVLGTVTTNIMGRNFQTHYRVIADVDLCKNVMGASAIKVFKLD